MATIKIKRGLEASRLGITPLEGELLYTTDTQKVYIGDGTTAGGVILNQPSSEILSKISTIDGTGSTLDGDLIHGLEGSQILRSDTDDIFSGELTLDDSTLSAISEIVNANGVVDVFLYDTSKDSDGGAWRYKTNKTSWYNETLDTATRGSTKEFPAMALIVVENTTVTIYDVTDSSCPMWMVFDQGGTWDSVSIATSNFNIIANSVAAITAKNGIISIAAVSGGYHSIEFIKELSKLISVTTDTSGYYNGNIEQRNDLLGHIDNSSVYGTIIHPIANDVAMTVLDNATIDTETGLPIPTIYVATEGGISRIAHDGTISNWVDTTGTVSIIHNIYINDDTVYFTTDNSYHQKYLLTKSVYDILEVEDWWTSELFYGWTDHNPATKPNDIGIFYDDIDNHIQCINKDSIGTNRSLTLINTSEDGAESHCNITKDFNSGWQYRDTSGAFLSSTNTADLVGTGELISNGTFDTNTTSWDDASTATLSVVSNALRITSTTTSFNARAYQPISTVAGSIYNISVDWITDNSSATVYIFVIDGNTGTYGGAFASKLLTLGETTTLTFTAQSSQTSILISSAIIIGEYIDIDNVTVKLADDDRSVNNNSLIVNGTVTRSAVENNSELMAYSGFSSSNYLEQPYNSDLDFGTGDFHVAAWIKTSNSVAQTSIISRDTAAVSVKILLNVRSNGLVRFLVDDGTANDDLVESNISIDDGLWHLVVGVKHGNNRISMYVDGILHNTTNIINATGNISDPVNSPTLFVGQRRSLTEEFNGSLSLVRIGASAPSDNQILEIYESERHLFQENAACTLNQFIDSGVTALAYDEDTQELLVAGSDNLDTFKGLVRTKSELGTYSSLSGINGIVAKGN